MEVIDTMRYGHRCGPIAIAFQKDGRVTVGIELMREIAGYTGGGDFFRCRSYMIVITSAHWTPRCRCLLSTTIWKFDDRAARDLASSF